MSSFINDMVSNTKGQFNVKCKLSNPFKKNNFFKYVKEVYRPKYIVYSKELLIINE